MQWMVDAGLGQARPSMNARLLSVWIPIAVLVGCGVVAEVPENLVLEGVPEPTPERRRAVAPYLQFRPFTFLEWHPRRRDVLVATRLKETSQLHEIRLPCGACQPLTQRAERVIWGSYAPVTGEPLVFSQDQGGNEFFQLYRLNAEDGAIALLTDGSSRNTQVCWERSGEQLAYASTRRNGRDTDLWILNPRRPESNRLLAEVSGGGWSVVDWSPDGSQVVAVSLVSATSSELHLVEVTSGRTRRVSPASSEPVSYTDAAFLPDGRELLVITDHGSDRRRLARLNSETGALVRWGPELAWGVDEFDLSSDGRVAAILTNEDGWSVLRLIDAATGAEMGRPRNLNGVASGLRWHPSRREIGMTLSSARAPGDVVSVDTRVNGVTRWTDGAVAGVRHSRFVEPELVRVKSFDGLMVSGLLYRPDPRRFPGPRPVVLHLHGGPEGQSRPVFLRAWNYVVQEMGVALLYPNVRGSEGYGKRFLTLDDGLRREDAVRDVGAFLDWMGGRSDLDSGRVAVYGGSYGGYMVLASLAHFGERLRCGIDVVGISNFRTFLENTQEYRRDLRRAEYGDERDPTMAAFLERISPLNQAHRIRRPLLVVQGRNDPRVPVTESEQMVRAIRGQGGTVGYLMAKDEGHGFTRKQNADFLFLVMVEFLERHLLND